MSHNTATPPQRHSQSQFIHQIQALVILDSNGQRQYAKYYHKGTNGEFDSVEKQKGFERRLWEKNQKNSMLSEPDVCLLDNHLCVYILETDLVFYLVADAQQNEIILSEVLLTITDALNMIFRNQLEKRTFLENFDLILLTIDEVIDDGIIMEIDALNVAKRVDKTEGLGLSEETDALAQVVKNAKDQISGFTSSFFSF